MAEIVNTRVACSTPVNLGLLLARVPLGLFFFLAGLQKIAGGVENFVSKVSGTVPSFMPPQLGSAYLHALPFVELFTGLMIIAGAFARIAGTLQALMLISFMIATGVKPPNGPFHTNFILLGMSLMLTLVGPGGWSVDQAMCGRKAVTQ